MASDNTSVFAFGSFGSFDATQFRGYYYQFSADEWQPLADLLPDGATSPEPRLSPTVIWNGAELLVYGGFDSVSRPQDDGGAYHPATDTWRVLSGSWRQSNPTRITEILGLAGHSALWTGAEMLIWGGLYETTGDGELTNRGWTYDPASGLWAITGPEPTIDDNFRLIPDDSAPAPRSGHDAIWTGSEMIVWGGVDAAGEPLADGGRYDPATDSWQPVATLNAPLTTPMTEAQWTGIEMLTWNGGQVVAPEFGGVPLPGIYLRGYDPLSDTWRTPDSAWEPAFLPDTRFFLLGSGSTVIAVGFDDREAFPRTLAAYSFDTATDQWRVGDTLDVPFCDIDAATYHLGQVYVSCSGRIYRFTP